MSRQPVFYLPPVIHTTTHNDNGLAVYRDEQTEEQSPMFRPVGPGVGIVYRTSSDGLVDTNGNADLVAALSGAIPSKSGLIPQHGCTVLVADFPPGCDSSAKIHRTLSVDVGVLTEGEIECHLDSGEIRLIKQGEILIQRGTKHFWVNPSSTKKARMICFVLPSKAVEGLPD